MELVYVMIQFWQLWCIGYNLSVNGGRLVTREMMLCERRSCEFVPLSPTDLPLALQGTQRQQLFISILVRLRSVILVSVLCSYAPTMSSLDNIRGSSARHWSSVLGSTPGPGWFGFGYDRSYFLAHLRQARWPRLYSCDARRILYLSWPPQIV